MMTFYYLLASSSPLIGQVVRLSDLITTTIEVIFKVSWEDEKMMMRERERERVLILTDNKTKYYQN